VSNCSSLVKFSQSRKESGGRALNWGRVHVDGLPFRGDVDPLLREEEYEQRAVRVADFKNGFFDVENPEQNRLYNGVLECCANGWFKLAFIQRFWKGTTRHYVEWVEYYLEDGRQVPAGPGVTGHGQRDGDGHPGFGAGPA
jgi:hypothetical protein